jgi:hypothetical protein
MDNRQTKPERKNVDHCSRRQSTSRAHLGENHVINHRSYWLDQNKAIRIERRD